MKYSKEELAILGSKKLKQFCEINGILEPTLNVVYDTNHEDHKRIKRYGTCGYYYKGVIHVAVHLCAHQSPLYSWAGYISDRTPYGVIQHELGHYVDEMISKTFTESSKRYLLSEKIRGKTNEDRITSYCPNDSEWFAEIFRLYVTNPDLLKLIRPKTYMEICEYSLRPCTTDLNSEILESFSAPKHLLTRLSKTLSKLR